MLTVRVAVIERCGLAIEDTGGGFRVVNCVSRTDGAPAPLLARSTMTPKSVDITTRRLMRTGDSGKGFGVVIVAI